MPVKPGVVVVGAGGHALVAIDVLRSAGFDIAGCVTRDGAASASIDRLSVAMIGSEADLPALIDQGHRVFVAIGDNEVRLRLSQRVRASGGRGVTTVSPHAIVAPSASIGDGVLIMPGVVVNALSRIEDGAILNTGCSIDHECVVGSFARKRPCCRSVCTRRGWWPRSSPQASPLQRVVNRTTSRTGWATIWALCPEP